MMTIPAHFNVARQPEADPAAVVHAGNARFTVLTNRLIRMEYSPTQQFDDRATQRFWHRRQPVPEYRVEREGDAVTIITDALTLTYRGAFSPEGLRASLHGYGTVWGYSDSDDGNLGGTSRTLDQIASPEYVYLEPGLISRDGWVVIDDSGGFALDERGWVAQRDQVSYQDLYFFGYGHDYKACLRDFSAVAGPAPLIPRWSLGNWWSRYYRYSQDDVKALISRFGEADIPLSVFVIDMDWHITQTGNASSGWTGYTWNRDLFPDPQALIAWMHDRGLHTCLNVHPADGVWPHEAAYPQVAAELGIDPASEEPVPFEIHEERFTQAYFRHLHHTQEAIGIDFWWLDWQHETYKALPSFDPLLWLNHLHAVDLGREPQKRPFTVSRWGGLGNHRYPIGFSGDSYVTWEVLRFLPGYTATAANVNFGWWSHDIGGHFYGLQEPELYVRWVQYGVLSPIHRLHSSNNPYEERHPWGYSEDVLRITRRYMQLRHALIPYLYTMAWRNTQTGLALCTPMYYDHPDAPEAYVVPQQYAFGDQLIAAPYVQKMQPELRLSRQVVWLPPGGWYDFFSGEYFEGDRWHATYGRLEDTVLLAKAGAIVPIAPPEQGLDCPQHLNLYCFAGADGAFTLYEDDGHTRAHERGAFSLTRITQAQTDDTYTLSVAEAEGAHDHLPEARRYTLHIHGLSADATLNVTIDGQAADAEHAFDSDRETWTIHLKAPVTQRVEVSATAARDLLHHRDRRLEHGHCLLDALFMDNVVKLQIRDRLPQILEDPARLYDDFVLVNDAQLRALSEVITGAGMDVVRLDDDTDVIRLWNARDDAGVRYLWSSWNFEERFRSEQAAVPRSHTVTVNHDRQWKVRLLYHGMHTVTAQNEYLQYRPGSTEAWLEGGYRQQAGRQGRRKRG